ncbi:MAG: cell division protein FtsQ/DivIB [Phycisphaerae bacterium]
MAKTCFRPTYHRPWEIPFVRRMLMLCMVLLTVALLVEGFSRLNVYGKLLMAQRAQKRPLKRIILVAAPPWLAAPILNSLAAEAVQYTIFNKQHPEYAAELRNPLDGKILRILAQHFTNDPSQGFNAWIKRVTYVRRVWLPHEQIIEIACQYRRPAGLVSVNGRYYLISPHAVRLPGVYTPLDLPALNWLMQISGVKVSVPVAGKRFSAPGITLGLQMIALLSGQPYAGQIQSIDLANVYADVPPTTPKIILKTRFGTSIYWGLPPGQEGFYEVPAARKLQLLDEVYRQYHRIDAGRAYLDVRSDEVLVPRPPPPTTSQSK